MRKPASVLLCTAPEELVRTLRNDSAAIRSVTRLRTLLLCGAAALVAAPARAQTAEEIQNLPPPAPSAPGPTTTNAPKHFFRGLGEIFLLEVGPWAWDRYIADEDFARISFDTIRENFHVGFEFDRDHFSVNQSSHPYHGSLFFAAGRSNGYDFWASGAFALTGSLLWECCMEKDPPSINDVVNTTLGGMTRGEISYRLAAMLRDNMASGSNRMWREIGGAILDPVGALNRLLDGDIKRDFPNPDERFPSGFSLSSDVGYRKIGGGAVHPDQATASLSARYGDPFEGDLHKPFESFWVGIDVNFPGGTVVSRIEERGILKGWELTEPDAPVRHIFGFSQEYEYLNNESQVVGAQMFGAGLLSRYQLGKLVAVTDLSVLAVPLAGIQTTNFENPSTGRNYDYAPGGGLRVAARLFGLGRELLVAGYGVVWARTVNGVSDHNTLQFIRTTARVPLYGPIGVGGGWWWYSRKTTYPGFFEARKTQSEWHAFINASFGATGLRKAHD
jgi:Domain of unknown function (DUF3943)